MKNTKAHNVKKSPTVIKVIHPNIVFGLRLSSISLVLSSISALNVSKLKSTD